MTKHFVALAITFAMAITNVTAQSKLIKVNADFASAAQTNNKALTVTVKKISTVQANALPVVPLCPSCLVELVHGGSDLWYLNVSGMLSSSYFEQNSVALLEHPVLNVYSSNGLIIDSFKLSEDKVDYSQSWGSGHPVTGRGTTSRQPASATITWVQTTQSGRVSNVTEQIPIR